ncbi:hypothetical protein [Glutamicibacter uratoxydans]|uniref:hypothetical protein n=1 Tax=Glutamicibacter uratoxydans TaxID=43667 RepID=UPI003D6F5AB0
MSTPSDRQDLQSVVDSTRQLFAEKRQRATVQLPYAAPDHRPNPARENLDWIRAGTFVLAAILLLVTVLVFASSAMERASSELLNVRPVQNLMWPAVALIVLFSSLYALLPSQLSSRRQRAVSIYSSVMAATMGCALTLAASFMFWAAVVLAVLSCAAGLLGIRMLNRNTARTTVERLLTDAPLSFSTGFSLVVTGQLYFAAAGWDDQTHVLKALVALLGISVIASVAAHSERGRHALALGFAIGTSAIALALWLNAAGPWWLSIVSALCGLSVVLAAENRRHQITHAEHRAARGLPVED